MLLRQLQALLRNWGTLARTWLDQRFPPRSLPAPPSPSPPRAAPPPAPSPLEAVEAAELPPVRTILSLSWERIELHREQRPPFTQEPFVPALYHRDLEILAAFGEPAPHSGAWLLHFGPRWAENLAAALKAGRPAVPVLLVHGAGHTANRSFGGRPLVTALENAGMVVFAITFAHPHGDNWQQAEALAGAIARVRTITDATQVDLVAHSKGAIPARLYTSGLHQPDGTPYRKDVRRLLLLGAPNNGIDMTFRHPMLFWFGSLFAGAPSPFFPPLQHSLYPGGAYPGQAQLVQTLKEEVPLRDPDRWNAHRTYEGGLTLYGYSRGVRWAAAAGGHLIDRLNATGADPDLVIAVLAGCSPHLMVDGMPIMGETDGESDGLVLTVSALHTAGIARRGARLQAADLLSLNHLELISDQRALAWVLAQLK